MDAVKFLKEHGRMCKSFGKCNCGGCGIYKLREKAGGRYTPSCDNIVKKLPEECVSIVEKWSAEHPVKTRLMDFLEKHPNAPLLENGLPYVLPSSLGYCPAHFCYDCPLPHEPSFDACWNLPLEE